MSRMLFHKDCTTVNITKQAIICFKSSFVNTTLNIITAQIIHQ